MSSQVIAIIMDVKVTNPGFDLICVHPPVPAFWQQ